MVCPFCGTHVPVSTPRCKHCYKSLLLYIPDMASQTADPSQTRNGPDITHTWWALQLGRPLLAVAFLIVLMWAFLNLG